ncbi:MAG: amidohydrolase family protein [Galbitalea sp.]
MSFGAVLDQGIRLDCISTDLTVQAREATVFSMTELMSRYFGFGFTLPEIIAMSTTNPAAALGIADRSGRLEVGRRADISVLDVRSGNWVVRDFFEVELRLSTVIVPALTVLAGELYSPDWGPHPWGWEPERATV